MTMERNILRAETWLNIQSNILKMPHWIVQGGNDDAEMHEDCQEGADASLGSFMMLHQKHKNECYFTWNRTIWLYWHHTYFNK